MGSYRTFNFTDPKHGPSRLLKKSGLGYGLGNTNGGPFRHDLKMGNRFHSGTGYDMTNKRHQKGPFDWNKKT